MNEFSVLISMVFVFLAGVVSGLLAVVGIAAEIAKRVKRVLNKENRS